MGGLPGVEAATFGLPIGGPQSPFTIAGQVPDDSKRIGSEPGRRRPPAHVRHPAAPRTDVRCVRGPARRSRRGDQRSRGEALARGREPDWRAGAPRASSRVRPGRSWSIRTRPPEVTVIGVMADTRNAGLRAEPQPTARRALFDPRPASAHARGPRRRRSEPAAQPRARAGARHGSGATARPASLVQRRCRAKRSFSRGSRWRCSARSRRSASRSRRRVSTASCRSM